MLQVATDSFTHTVSDIKGGADTAIISVVVQAVLDVVDVIYSISRLRVYGSQVLKSSLSSQNIHHFQHSRFFVVRVLSAVPNTLEQDAIHNGWSNGQKICSL